MDENIVRDSRRCPSFSHHPFPHAECVMYPSIFKHPSHQRSER
uniref:Uncharacterized protein n=1 Tax=Arundo donax TaxID=35708 RepID=A0A0A9C012_ARUDO